MSVQVGVLGPLEARRDGASIDLGAPKPRMLLTALALTPGRAVSVDALLDLIWGDSPTPGAMSTLHAYVSGLRKVLEPGRSRRSTSEVLVTQSPGYLLRVTADDVDAGRFAATVNAWHRRLAGPLAGPGPDDATDHLADGVAALDEVLSLWRGEPYAELGDLPAAVAERGHLEELRLVALEDRAWARLALGDHAPVAAELEPLTATYPLRERLWALRALALVRAGRQADALDALRTVREVLADELGLDPGVELQDLQERILRQDPALAWTAPVSQPAPEPYAAPPAEAPTPPPASAGEWPLLGRDEELAVALGALGRAVHGRTEVVVVTGDPGIGKSRLCGEVLAHARSRGALVLTGRCSQDDGAPPLYPWRSVLQTLGAEVPADTGEGNEFRTWEQLVELVHAAAATQPVVLFLDDLHWADTSTLRALRLLAESSAGIPLLVLVTWRDRPAPTGALADLADTLARRHAERVTLTGLDGVAVAAVVGALTEQWPSEEETTALRDRTDGNPFFLVEYSRLVGRGDALSTLLRDEPPTAVRDVVGRRLERLPEGTLRLLGVAAVLGREVDVALLAATAGEDEDTALDLLDPALALGLVHEDGPDRFAFDHAMVRDTLVARLPVSRRARVHARAAAALAGSPGRETETARHWLAAGPSHAASAWPAAARAAEVHLAAHAHEEAVELAEQALTALDQDPAGTAADRADLLVRLATAQRWASRWDLVAPTVERAIAAADESGDPALLARAATLTSEGAVWQTRRHSQANLPVIDALRRALDRLPTTDSQLRCRALMALAAELYYVAGVEERQALCDEAVAMARRLGEPGLLCDVLLGVATALWVPGQARARLAWAEEAIEAAHAVGDLHRQAEAHAYVVHVAAELGDPDRMWAEYAVARPLAERLRMSFALFVLETVVIPWLAMREQRAEADRAVARFWELVPLVGMEQMADGIAGVVTSTALWLGDPLPDGILEAVDASPLPTNCTIAWLLFRSGDEEGARRWHRDHPAQLDHFDWFSRLDWCFAGALAAFTGDAALGAHAYRLIAPYSGEACCAGTGVAAGPLDGYLALAAHAAGETATARRHADAAERQAERWGVPRYTVWLRGARKRLGF